MGGSSCLSLAASPPDSRTQTICWQDLPIISRWMLVARKDVASAVLHRPHSLPVRRPGSSASMDGGESRYGTNPEYLTDPATSRAASASPQLRPIPTTSSTTPTVHVSIIPIKMPTTTTLSSRPPPAWQQKVISLQQTSKTTYGVRVIWYGKRRGGRSRHGVDEPHSATATAAKPNAHRFRRRRSGQPTPLSFGLFPPWKPAFSSAFRFACRYLSFLI